MRYTHRRLERDVEDWNRILEERGHEYRFVVGGAYNCTQIDVATPAQMAEHVTSRQIESGTPRECRAKCLNYIAHVPKTPPLTEKEEGRRGALIADALGLRKDRRATMTNGKPFWKTDVGTKTNLGLFRLMERFVLDGE